MHLIHACIHSGRCQWQPELRSVRHSGLRSLIDVCLLVALLWVVVLLGADAALAQGSKRDPNAPFNDAYDVLYGADLVGTWKGTVRGSSISQRDGVVSGQAVFPRRGYENRNTFGINLHDHRHRKGQVFSQIMIGDLPCGPKGQMTPVAHGLELQGGRAGFGSVIFENWLADTQRDDMSVYRNYGALRKNPGVVQTEWTSDTFTLRLTSTMVAGVAPVKNHTFDYERQKEGYLDSLDIDLEFTLRKTPRTQAIFDWTQCDQTEFEPMQVVETTPEHGRENVLLEGSEFLIELDTPLYVGSLDETTVILSTRDQANGYVFVATDVSLDAPDRIRVVPKETLLPGTIYEIELVSGEDGVRGRDSEVLPADFRLAFSTVVDPERVQVDLYQVSRNAAMVYGKPAVARVATQWKERDDIHSAWQVLSYPIRIEIKDEYEQAFFPEKTGRVKRPDLLDKEEIRLGKRTLDVYGWSPSIGRSPTTAIALVYPDDPYPEDIEPVPAIAEQSIDYASRQVDRLMFDYYIAEHSEWLERGADPDVTNAIHVAAMRDRLFANQIFPVVSVIGRFQGRFNVQDTICGVPGAKSWMVCREGFNSWNDPRSAAANNDFGPFFELMHEQIAAHSTADILVAYHPPSLQGGGQATSPFEQPQSLTRTGDEPYWFGEPDPPVLERLHGDRSGRNMVVMTTLTRDNQFVPAIMLTPLVAHEFGHIFGLPHTPYAESNEHRGQICRKQHKTIAAGIEGMRVSLDGATGWQKSSKDGNAQSSKPLLNLMFPCLYETRDKYWIDPNQYDWLLENMPAMVRHSRTRMARTESSSITAQAENGRSDRERGQGQTQWHEMMQRAAQTDRSMQAQRWLFISGWNDGESGGLLPAVTVAGPRPDLTAVDAPDAALEVRVLGLDGVVLASDLVASGHPDKGAKPFARTFAIRGEPGRVQLMRGEHVLAESKVVPGLKPSAFVSHKPGDVFKAGEELVWHNDHQGSGLVHALRYSADGEQWRTLAILLPGQSFTPDMSSLSPGDAPEFELLSSDGVRSLATRLPVRLSIPFAPIGMWPTGHPQRNAAALAGYGFASVLLNAPIQMDTLGAVRLLSEGKVVAHQVTFDATGSQLTVTPSEPVPDREYTLVVGPELQSVYGDSLVAQIRIQFTGVDVQEDPSVLAWPARRHDKASKATVDSTKSPASESYSGQSGQGEITLALGQPVTLDMQVLDCLRNQEMLESVRIEFQIPGADSIQIDMTREQGDLISATASHGPRATGTDGQDWTLQWDGGQAFARGSLGDDQQSTAFEFRGTCPILME